METQKKLVASIKKSWALLIQQVPKFPEELGRRRFFALEGSLTLQPAFYSNEGRLQCVQTSYFGFYALRAIVRGILLSVNHLAAAELAANHELYGPSMASAYAAAYHAIGSLLALNGRVFCDATSEVMSEAHSEHAAVAMVLTRNSKWICELRNRTHRTRWLEVAQVYEANIDQLPKCFNKVFYYYYPQARPGYGAALAQFPQFNRPTPSLCDNLKRLLELIASARHGALYETFGSDPYVYEALVNGDAHSSYGLGNQAALFVSFAELLLLEVADSTLCLIKSLGSPNSPRKWLFLCTYFPWFDSPKCNKLENAELAAAIESINRWVTDFQG